MNKKQKNKKNTPKKACTTPAKPSNQQIRRYYQETAEDNRRADGKNRSLRGNCLCNGR